MLKLIFNRSVVVCLVAANVCDLDPITQPHLQHNLHLLQIVVYVPLGLPVGQKLLDPTHAMKEAHTVSGS